MTKKKVSVVITDLDNTLYDWFEMWHQSFSAMLDRLVALSGLKREDLVKEIKKIHEKHGTAEYLALIPELQSLKEKHPEGGFNHLYEEAINIYREKRKETLHLYPSVLATLMEIKKRGAVIIGYTESQAFYTEYRIKELGLDGIIDFLYSPPSHPLPENGADHRSLFITIDNHKLEHTIHRFTPVGEFKPNPDILLSIIEDIDAPVENVIYVGDSKTKDIEMAQAANILDVHAAYGVANKRPEYELLRQVTHWKDDHVSKEKDEGSIKPSFELKTAFRELLDLFDFVPFKGMKVADNKMMHYLEIWKKTIDVQQHFNDLELRIRNFAITVLGVILSAAALSLRENISVSLFGATAPLAILLIAVALITWLAFYFMDRHWYHRLLKGAVNHGEAIEKRLSSTIPEIALTKSISKQSPIMLSGLRISSSLKMNLFYFTVAGALAVLALMLVLNQAPAQNKNQNNNLTIKVEGADKASVVLEPKTSQPPSPTPPPASPTPAMTPNSISSPAQSPVQPRR